MTSHFDACDVTVVNSNNKIFLQFFGLDFCPRHRFMYMGVILRAYFARDELHIQGNANGEVATIPTPFLGVMIAIKSEL